MRLAAAGLSLVIASTFSLKPTSSPARPLPAVDTTPTSTAWLARLPDGEAKRQFIIDCTNCHQLDERHIRPATPRSEADWIGAVTRMLGYAGASTAFPVMSSGRDAAATAAWLHRHLGARPTAAQISTPVAASADIREYLFPAEKDLPHDLAVDAAGRVIVTGMFSHTMHLLDPASEIWSEVPIPVEKSNPRALELDRSGNWWVVLGSPNQLAKYDGSNWEFWNVGMYAHSVALDSTGGAWVNGHFTKAPELLAHIVGRNVTNHALPLHARLASDAGGPVPYEIRTGPDGSVWMSELQGNRIIRYQPTSDRSDVFEMPTSVSGPRRLDVDAQGIVWIPTYGAGTLVRLDPTAPAARRFTEIALPIKDAAPYIARVHPRTGTVWIGTGTADAIFAYHPRERRFDYYPLPSRGANVRHLAFDPRSNDVWLAYGESPGKNSARIARLRPAIP